MAINYGKQFESKFKIDFLSSIKDSTLDRLYDVQMGFKSISQVSDFIGYVYPNIFYLECKSHHGASFPFTNLTQYDKLMRKVGIPGVRVGVVLWLIDKDKLFYVPVSTITKMKNDGKKSLNYKDDENYNIINIPAIKKKVFMEGNYSILTTLKDGE